MAYRMGMESASAEMVANTWVLSKRVSSMAMELIP